MRWGCESSGSDAAAQTQLTGRSGVEHLWIRSAMRCNNRVEPAHGPARVREPVMRRFKSTASAQRFLDAFSRVCTQFRPGRHLVTAAADRATMRARVATRRAVAGLRAA